MSLSTATIVYRGKSRRRAVATILLVLAVSLMSPPAALAADTWTVTGSLNTGRWHHTATLLADGQVLVRTATALHAFSGNLPKN